MKTGDASLELWLSPGLASGEQYVIEVGSTFNPGKERGEHIYHYRAEFYADDDEATEPDDVEVGSAETFKEAARLARAAVEEHAAARRRERKAAKRRRAGWAL